MLHHNDWAHVFKELASSGITNVTTITLLGAVNKPGVMLFPKDKPLTILRVAFKAGDFPKSADLSAVKVMRDIDGKETTFTVDIQKLLETGDEEDNFVLQDGDRIIVPEKVLFD